MTTSDGNTNKGKSTSWSDKEKIALAQAAQNFCIDATVGSQQTKASFGRRICEQFILDQPSKSNTERDGTECYDRLWEVRSAETCVKAWMA